MINSRRKRNMISCKKGNVVFDLIFLVIVLVVFSIVIVFGYGIFTEINGDIQNDLTLNESVATMQVVENRYPSVFDSLAVFILFGLWTAGIVSALMSDQHPLMFGFLMILIVFVLIAGAMISNYFQETFEDDSLSTYMDSFPMTNWVINHLLEISIVVSLSIALALMGKNRI